MAITTTPLFTFPSSWFPTSGSFQPYTGLTIDAAGEKAAFVCRAPKAGTISKVAFRTVTFTGGGDVDVRLETVDLTTGDPSGTLLAANTNGTQTIAAANTVYTKTLTAGAVVTRGQLLAAVIAYTSGNYQIAAVTNTLRGDGGFPYSDHFTAAWAKQSFSPAVAFEYDDGSYSPMMGVLPPATLTSLAIASNTTPDEVGVQFTVPVSVQVCGFYIAVELDQDGDVVLYDSASTALATVSLDKDCRMTTSSGFFVGRFTTQITLTAGATYRLAFKPTTTTNLTFWVLDVTAAMMAAFPGGTAWVYTSRTDAGAWTDTTTRYAPLGLICDGIDAGTSGSHFIGG